MKTDIRVLCLALMLSCAPAWADVVVPAEQSAAASPVAPLDQADRPKLAFAAPMQPMIKAFERSGLSEARGYIDVSYGTDGTILSAKLGSPTGDDKLDAALLDWAKHCRLDVRHAGSGKLPFNMSK